MRPFRLVPARSARGLVTRPRLLAVLGERFDRRLLVVVAGAGFGKSTLLAQAVAENRLDPRGVDVWLSCSPDDVAASQLATGLLAALGAEPSGITEPIATIGAAVWERAPAEVALLLDDVHVLVAGSSGAALLDELLRTLPANGHLVLAGRADPAVGWSRLAAAGEAREIREADLAFAEQELVEFARLREVPPALLTEVAGWPALAELTASTGRARVADFLWEEVLSGVPAADRRLLAAVVAAGGADDAVASALAGQPVAVAALLAGLPLVSQAERGWYHLHALWQPALARELTPAQVIQVRRTAGRMLHERGDLAAAARLYADAGAWDEFDRLIVDTCQATYPPVGNDVLGEWLRRLPADRRAGPAALLLEATLLLITEPLAGQNLLRRAAEGFRAVGDLPGEIACLSTLALLVWWQQDLTAIGQMLPRVAELTATGGLAGRAADSLAVLSMWVRLVYADVSGDTAGALGLIESVPVTRFSVGWQVLFDLYRGLQHLALGDPGTALVFAERAASNQPEGGVLTLVISCLHLLGRRDDVLNRLPAVFTIRSQPQNRVTDHALAAVWLAWAGQSEEARQHLQAATQAAHAISTPMTPVFLNAAQLAVALADDDEAVAGLAAEVHRLCVDQPSLARLVDRLFLAVQYRLLPETRAWWNGQPLQGCYAAGRELARVLVALDEGGNPDLARGAGPGLIRAFLPARWVTDLTAAGGRFAAMVAAAAPAALSDATAPSVHVQLLGPARLLRDETPVTSPLLRRGRVRELLAYLLLHHGARRERVAADLWPDLDEAAAALNLRVTLSYLGRLLEPDRPRIESSRLLNRTGGQINLVDSPLLTVDVWTFDQLLDQAGQAEQQHAPSVALARYKLAITTYTGPLLADQPVPDWLLPHRDRLRRRFVTAAVRAGELLLADGAKTEPLHLARRAVATEEGSEPAHQLLVSAYLAAGNHIAARHALDDCHRMLRSLGASPDARTRMLTRQLTSTVSTQRLTTG